MKIVYLHWRDACHDMNECRPAETGLIDLHEVGFLLHETDEFVTLSCEHPGDSDTARLWLSVPKTNIVERRDTTVEKAFPTRRGRRK